MPDELGKNQAGCVERFGWAIIAMFVGFNYGGWMTTGAAETMAKESATTAVAERLGSICLAQLNRDAAKNQNFGEMKDKMPGRSAVLSKSRTGQSCWEREARERRRRGVCQAACDKS